MEYLSAEDAVFSSEEEMLRQSSVYMNGIPSVLYLKPKTDMEKIMESMEWLIKTISLWVYSVMKGIIDGNKR